MNSRLSDVRQGRALSEAELQVTILRQSRRLSVAGPSKGPDRNRPKAARRAASAGLAAGVFAAQKPPLKVIRLGMLRERHIPGYVKLLLPPRQSRGISQRIRGAELLRAVPPCGERPEDRRKPQKTPQDYDSSGYPRAPLSLLSAGLSGSRNGGQGRGDLLSRPCQAGLAS